MPAIPGFWAVRTGEIKMVRRGRKITWPFLFFLACMFVVSATLPRAWEQLARSESADEVLVALSEEPSGPVGGESDTARQSPPISPPAAEADTQPDDRAPEPTAPEEPQEETFQLQLLDPAQQLGDRVIEPEQPQRLLPVPAALPPEVATRSPSTVDRAPIFEAPPLGLPARKPVPSPDESAAELAGENHAEIKILDDLAWQQPEALLTRLDDLAGDGSVGRWAREVGRQVQLLGSAVSRSSDEKPSIIQRLRKLAGQVDSLVEEKGEGPLAGKLRRVRHALVRRLDVWELALPIDGSTPERDLPAADPERLALALGRFEAVLRGSDQSGPWREYLHLDALRNLTRSQTAMEDERTQLLARRVLRRLVKAKMTDRQRAFVTAGPLAALGSELQHWAAEPVDLGELLRNLEQYEETGLPSDGRRMAEQCRRLEFSPIAEYRELGRRLETHYCGANVRTVLTGELLNRLVPQRDRQYSPVNDTILGQPVRGRSLTSSNTAVRLIPDPGRLLFALEITGQVSALTSSSSGPATFVNNSQSRYTAWKQIELCADGFHVQPAKVQVRHSTRLRSLRTDLDGIPVVASLVQGVARNRHQEMQDDVRREVRQKVAAQAKQQVDGEADARFDQLTERMEQQILQPLGRLALGPTMISTRTTKRRMAIRLRLAADHQVAAHTPRPRAPSDSLASFQVHESAFNNVLEQLELGGGTFTPDDLRRRLADKLNSPEIMKGRTVPDDLTITFAEKDAAGVRCQDGQLIVTLSVDRLTQQGRQWEDFKIRAFYRPRVDGRSAELVRHGVIHLIGRRLNTSAQIALRGIFSKTFSKDEPWQLTPESLRDDPRLKDLAVTQLVLEDGWIGVALGPRRGGQTTVARRDAKANATRR